MREKDGPPSEMSAWVDGDRTLCTAAITKSFFGCGSFTEQMGAQTLQAVRVGVNPASESSPGCAFLLSTLPSLGLSILVWKMSYRAVPVTVLI